MNTRRKFLKSGVIAGIAGLTLPKFSRADLKSNNTRELKLGIAGYSFVNFNLPDSLAMMQRMNVRYLCIKDFHLPLDSDQSTIQSFHHTLQMSNVKGYAVGPIYMKTEQEVSQAFEYAKRVGVDLIIGIPSPESLEYVDQHIKKYNIRYAIHNHGPEDKLYPNASTIYKHIKSFDERMGMCFDMGHNMRDGEDPIRDLERYKHRIFDIHLKNVTSASAEGTTCELGRGVIDIPLFVRTLDKIKYNGVCSLEFEKDMKDPLAGLAESKGYFQGVCNTLNLKVD